MRLAECRLCMAWFTWIAWIGREDKGTSYNQGPGSRVSGSSKNSSSQVNRHRLLQPTAKRGSPPRLGASRRPPRQVSIDHKHQRLQFRSQEWEVGALCRLFTAARSRTDFAAIACSSPSPPRADTDSLRDQEIRCMSCSAQA